MRIISINFRMFIYHIALKCKNILKYVEKCLIGGILAITQIIIQIQNVQIMTKFNWQRAVIKVGSALVAPQSPFVNPSMVGTNKELNAAQLCRSQNTHLQAIAEFIAHSMAQGKEVILVSSGSIALARSQIKTGLRASIAEKQAMAALGQTKMMTNWASLLQSLNPSNPINCAQVLLTVDDLADRKRFVNIKNTLEQLIINGALPIVNENDTVAVEEIKVGDNDNLAAHTAIAAQADCLIICTDVDGLFTANPRIDNNATLLTEVNNIDSSIIALAGGAGSSVGTGGMITKLQAAQKCTQSGIQTLLVNGTKPHSFTALAKGVCTGTYFAPINGSQRSRQDWLTHTSKVKGQLTIDNGANKALHVSGASLLAVGVTGVQGKFVAGDSVEVMHQHKVVAKGLVNYASTELTRIKGCNSKKIIALLGYSAGDVAIHRNNLVLTERGK